VTTIPLIPRKFPNLSLVNNSDAIASVSAIPMAFPSVIARLPRRSEKPSTPAVTVTQIKRIAVDSQPHATRLINALNKPTNKARNAKLM
jgi:hypothetical protein